MCQKAMIRLEMIQELMELRSSGDKALFMERLYEAITGPAGDGQPEGILIPWKREGILEMIGYFTETEAYEKCAALMKYVQD